MGRAVRTGGVYGSEHLDAHVAELLVEAEGGGVCGIAVLDKQSLFADAGVGHVDRDAEEDTLQDLRLNRDLKLPDLSRRQPCTAATNRAATSAQHTQPAQAAAQTERTCAGVPPRSEGGQGEAMEWQGCGNIGQAGGARTVEGSCLLCQDDRVRVLVNRHVEHLLLALDLGDEGLVVQHPLDQPGRRRLLL